MATLKNTVINSTNQTTLPKGTTAQRPSNPGDGAMRFNTDLGYVEYYFKGCVSWSWKYNYSHAPTLSDLSKYLDANDINAIKFTKGRPYHASVQLMSILPKQSKNLIPPKYHYFMNDITSPIIGCYPETYQLDHVFKRYAWQCEPILPDFNYNILSKLIKKCSLNVCI